jgi:hypothetical protein
VIRPEGIESLEGVVANAKPNATVTMPASWIRELLAYLCGLERSASSRMTTHISPGTATAPQHQLEIERRIVG